MSIRLAPLFLLVNLCGPLNLSAQDTIIFEGQYNYIVDIVEERERKVIFRKLNLKKSPTYVIDKRFITDIFYQNPDSASQKFNPAPLYAQRSLELWVLPEGSEKAYRGQLDRLTDSTIVFKGSRKPKLEKATGLPAEVDVFHYQKIKTIEVRRRDKMKRLAFWGALGGFTVGTLVGLASSEDTPPCDPNNIDGMPCDPSLSSPRTRWEKALLFGAAGGGAGMLTGGVIGSVKVRIPIEGRKDAYNAAIPKLERLYLEKD